MTIKVAAVQFMPSFADLAGNFVKIVALAKEAAAQGAELIVFPELATTGYSFMSKEHALPYGHVLGLQSPMLKNLSKLTGSLKIHLVLGFMEKDFGTGDLYNSQILIDPVGDHVVMRKINMWGNDYLWAKPGQSNPPVMKCTFRDGSTRKVGLLICRDIRDKKNDEWKSFYSKGDADIVCFSSNWGDGGFPAVSWMDFVEKHRVGLIVSNRYGKEANNDFGEGGVCVVQASGEVACQGLVWNQDCIVYGEL